MMANIPKNITLTEITELFKALDRIEIKDSGTHMIARGTEQDRQTILATSEKAGKAMSLPAGSPSMYEKPTQDEIRAFNDYLEEL